MVVRGAVNWLVLPTLSHHAFVLVTKLPVLTGLMRGKGCQIMQTTLSKANKDSNID